MPLQIVGRAGITFLPDGRIVYAAPSIGNMDIWVMNPDGSGQKQLTSNFGEWNGRQIATPDGQHIVFVSMRSGSRAIWRMSADGSEPKQLSPGKGEDYPGLSPDGKTIYYDTEIEGVSAISRMTIDGGEPERITKDYEAAGASVSPDGKLIAFSCSDLGDKKSWKVCLMDPGDKAIVKKFDFAPYRSVLHWTPDSKSLVYLLENSPNLWIQRIDGGPPRQDTFFNLEETWNFALSPDHKSVAVARGYTAAEAVLITDFF
jgi:Tol biopolymer transport system component